MILTGKPAMFGVTTDTAGLRVGARVFDASNNPTGPWALMFNYDGFSYQIPITFPTEGAYSVKKVVFLSSDTNFTQRDPAFLEADSAIQVVDNAGGGGSGASQSAAVVGYLTRASKPIVGVVQNQNPIVGNLAEEE